MSLYAVYLYGFPLSPEKSRVDTFAFFLTVYDVSPCRCSFVRKVTVRESEPSSKVGIKCGDGQKIHRELKRQGRTGEDDWQSTGLSLSLSLLHLALSNHPNQSCDFAKTNM